MKNAFRFAACAAVVSALFAMFFYYFSLFVIFILVLLALVFGKILYLALFDEDIGIFGYFKK